MAIKIRKYKKITYLPKEINDTYSLLLSLWIALFFSLPITSWNCQTGEGIQCNYSTVILCFFCLAIIFGFVLVMGMMSSYGHRTGSYAAYIICIVTAFAFGYGLHLLLLEIMQKKHLQPWEIWIVWAGPAMVLYKIIAFEIVYGVNSFKSRRA